MAELQAGEVLFAGWAFLFQLVLIAHFAVRGWRMETAIRYGWVVYALGVPAAGISLLLWSGGSPWWLWVGGVLYLVWGIFGFVVEYVLKVDWREPIVWPVFGPYVMLYLGTLMFYWWPLGRIARWMWYVYTVLFVVSTWLNVRSHRAPADKRQPGKV